MNPFAVISSLSRFLQPLVKDALEKVVAVLPIYLSLVADTCSLFQENHPEVVPQLDVGDRALKVKERQRALAALLDLEVGLSLLF